MPHPNELVITYLEAGRGLLWTEFVPVRAAAVELQRAVDAGDTARADGLRTGLDKTPRRAHSDETVLGFCVGR